MDRVILHCDLNSFYASVELLDHPELRDRPVAVCGDPNSRHGIILAKNEPAKRYKVQTAETIWQARRKCPELVLLPAHHWKYRDYSKKVNAVYERYTDLVEPFSIDESWLDITGSLSLPISQVEPGLKQPRKRFDEESLQDLADSIRIHGIIQPLTVRRLSSGYYQIIAGERRWRAAKLAGLSEIPAVIIEADDRKVMELGLIENLQREDLNPIEEANGYKVLMSEYGLTQEEVAQRVGKSRPAVANALRLLTLPDPVHLLLEEGKLSAGHARAILAVPSGELQKKLAQKVIAEELSVRQTEALAKRLAAEPREAAEPKSAAGPDLSIYLREAEKTLATRFGRKVHIINGRKKGKIELEYYNPEDLNTLLELLEQLPSAGKGGVSL